MAQKFVHCTENIFCNRNAYMTIIHEDIEALEEGF